MGLANARRNGIFCKQPENLGQKIFFNLRYPVCRCVLYFVLYTTTYEQRNNTDYFTSCIQKFGKWKIRLFYTKIKIFITA